MKLIEDLGMMKATEYSKKPIRFGLYECPICKTHFKCSSKSVKSRNTTKCNACARKLVGEKKRTFDRDFPKLYNKFLNLRLQNRLSDDLKEYKLFKEYLLELGYEEGLRIIATNNNLEIPFTKGNIQVSMIRKPIIKLEPLNVDNISNIVKELQPRRYGKNQDIIRILRLECIDCGIHYESIYRKSKQSLRCPTCVNKTRASKFEIGQPLGTNGITYVGESQKGTGYAILNCGFCSKDFEGAYSTYTSDNIKSCGCLSGKSSLELQVRDFIKSLNLDFKSNDRTIITPKELDLIIPSHNLAIEFNGLYWHSELAGKTRNYHLDKTKECNKAGYNVIHIFEHQWVNKQDIIKDIIKKRLGIVDRKVFARKCEIREVETLQAREFIETNHLQGYASATYKLGLYYENELISIMTFGKSRYDKNCNWELIRFANKLGYNVIGGASKILKHFRSKYEGSIISYCDISIFSGNLYKDLGFIYSHNAKPNYFYFDSMLNVYSRVMFQKHKLKDKLANFDPSKSEWENMIENKFNRYWDCGNAVYILK